MNHSHTSVHRTLTVTVDTLTSQQIQRLEVEIEQLLANMTREGQPSGRTALGWSRELVEEALRWLEYNNGTVQAEVIRRAIKNDGGAVSRDEVYAIGGYDADRTLRGFTRPVNRVHKLFVEEGRIPEDAADLLSTWYDGGVLADSFYIPAEIAALFA